MILLCKQTFTISNGEAHVEKAPHTHRHPPRLDCHILSNKAYALS